MSMSDTQKEGIEYPTRVAMVIETSAGRPRLHPDTRPRRSPSHIVTAVASPTRMSVVDNRGAITLATGWPPFWYVMVVPRFPCRRFSKYRTYRVVSGWSRPHWRVSCARRSPPPYVKFDWPRGSRTRVGSPGNIWTMKKLREAIRYTVTAT